MEWAKSLVGWALIIGVVVWWLASFGTASDAPRSAVPPQSTPQLTERELGPYERGCNAHDIEDLQDCVLSRAQADEDEWRLEQLRQEATTDDHYSDFSSDRADWEFDQNQYELERD